MQLRHLALIFFLWAPAAMNAQSVSTLMGARAAGMGYTSATLSDEWSVFNNVAGLAKVAQATAGVAGEVRPSVEGSNRIAAVITAPVKKGVVGIGMFRFGDDLYSEQIASAAYANQIGLTSLGLQVNYIQYRTEGFGNHGAFGINLGGITQLTPQLALGAYIVNLNQATLSKQAHEQLPTLLVAGLSYKPIDVFMFAAEIRKDLDYEPVIRAGIEYFIRRKFIFRTGFNLHPMASFVGFGFAHQRMKIDYALQYNTIFNLIHQMSLAIKLTTKRHGDTK